MKKDHQGALEIREKTLVDGFFAKYVLKYIFLLLYKVMGWTAGPVPKTSGVVICAPHTSNWDFIIGIGAAIILDIKVYFSIKDSWCRLPIIGPFIMYLGAIPIDRSTQGQGQVEQIARFAEKMSHRWVYFAFTPEGTRSKVERWRTGFYHMAQDCNLPIHLARLDFENKLASIFHSFHVTGDKNVDIEVIQAAYERIRGQNPEKQFPAYKGQPQELSNQDIEIMSYLYHREYNHDPSPLLKDHSSAIVSLLLEKGLIEKTEKHSSDDHYSLTHKGKGTLLHNVSTLVNHIPLNASQSSSNA